MNEKVYVTFETHQVAFQTDVPAILKSIEIGFQYMLTTEPCNLITEMEVQSKHNDYQLSVGGDLWATYPSIGETVQALHYEIPLQLIQERSDLLWLHAGAISNAKGAIIVSGASGKGKSTLVSQMCQRGWSFLSDDILPLDMQVSEVMPFPKTPMVRYSAEPDLPAELLRSLKKRRFVPSKICEQPVPILAIIFPQYKHQAVESLVDCSPATATVRLLEHNLNFVRHREKAVAYLSRLLTTVPAYTLPFADGAKASEIVGKAYDIRP